MRVRRKQWTSSKTAFDPNDEKRIRHKKFGIWDYYEEISPELEKVPGGRRLEQLNAFRQSLPYVWLMLKDLSSLRSTWVILPLYAAISLVMSFLPAVTLWYSGQLLKIVSKEKLLCVVLIVTRMQHAGGDSSDRENS